MKTVIGNIPSAGTQWRIKLVVERNQWLTDNVDTANYKAYWDGWHSDIFNIEFSNGVDATVYILRWIANGHNTD